MDSDHIIQPVDIMNDARDAVSSSSDHHAHSSMTTFARDLLEIPNSQVNLERSGRRLRLRFKMIDAKTGRTIRNALELPNDERLAAELADAIQTHRQARRDAKAALRNTQLQDKRRWRKAIRKRFLAACQHGRVVRRRLALIFDLAFVLGYCFLMDFLRRRPWLAKSLFHDGHHFKRS